MPTERSLRIAAAVIAIAGFAVSTYIAIEEGGGGSPKCLVGGGGCETVAESKYSDLAGINVAVIGIAGYSVLLASALVPGDLGRFGGFMAALIGFGFSQWCVASAILMTLSLAVAAARAFAYTGMDAAAPPIQSPHGR